MREADAFAAAKINLSLHVTGRRDDGYHLLDSLVVFADIGDRLWFQPAHALSITVTGAYAAGVPTDARNLAWRAAAAARQACHIRLEKNLPHGAGIGGGSADAAAVLRYFQCPGPAAGLGADVPVCLASRSQRMRGIGDILDEAPGVPKLTLLLVNPGVEVRTPDVFRALARRENPPMSRMPEGEGPESFLEWLAKQRNDLQPAAVALAPPIAEVLAALGDARIARMSGSGSTCFGVYDSAEAAERAAHRIADGHPSWWVRVARTI